MRSDPFSQSRVACRRRVAEHMVVEGSVCCGDDTRRRGSRWLTDLEVQHVTAGQLALLGCPHDLHHVEGLDLATLRRPAAGRG